MKANFIDIDIIIKSESSPWIVDKANPNIPIMKIEKHDFNLFKSGVYKGHGNKLEFNGKVFWISTEVMNRIKVKTKNKGVDISNLAISMQEFMNSELIENIPYEIDKTIFNSLVNTQDHIYIICSKNTKSNYSKAIKTMETEMSKVGLSPIKYYFVSETFYNRDDDQISFNKIKLLLQHLVGLKTDGDKFINEDVTNYDEVILWDDNKTTISLGKDINTILENLLVKTDDSVKSEIKNRIKNTDNLLILKEWTHNKSNKYNQYEIEIQYSNVIRSFENFNLNESKINKYESEIFDTLQDMIDDNIVIQVPGGPQNYVEISVLSNFNKKDHSDFTSTILNDLDYLVMSHPGSHRITRRSSRTVYELNSDEINLNSDEINFLTKNMIKRLTEIVHRDILKISKYSSGSGSFGVAGVNTIGYTFRITFND